MLSESAAWGFREWSAAKRQRVLRQAQHELEMEITRLEAETAYYEEAVSLTEGMRAVEAGASEYIMETAKPPARHDTNVGVGARVERQKIGATRVRRARITAGKRP